MLRRVALVRADVSEERIASIIRVTRIGEQGNTLTATETEARCEETLLRSVSSQRASVASYCNVVPSSPILFTSMMQAIDSSETSAITRATRPNILYGGILHSHRHEILKSYIALTGPTQ
jgi:hypothetical protein